MKTVILATLMDSFQAKLLQDKLSNEGIDSFLKNEGISAVLNVPGFQIELYVLEEDYAKAKEILKKGFPDLV